MPIPIEDIEQAVQGSELVTTTYAACDGLVATEGAPFRKLPKDTYALEGHTEHESLVFPDSDFGIEANTGNLEIGTTGVSFVKLQPNGVLKLQASSQISGDSLFRVTNDIQTRPAGGGHAVTSDDFVLWSELIHKEEVRPLESTPALTLEPKEFTVAGQKHAGFIVEDVETKLPEAIRIYVDDGETSKGISQGDLLSHLYRAVQLLEARVVELESGGIR